MSKLFKLALYIFTFSISIFSAPSDSAWIPLFNGKSLDGWVIKFSDRPIGENPFNSFSVNTDSGWLVVTQTEAYSKVGYGQISYEARKFSYFMVRVEYKFTSRLAPGYDWWAEHNNGVLVHSQSIATMKMAQWFPDAIELQLMGQYSATKGMTGNVCTPGTKIHFNNVLYNDHCRNAAHPALDHSAFTRVEGVFLADSLGIHKVKGKTVLTYQKMLRDDNTPLKDGYIMLQAEGAGTIFRKLDILDLKGCMDPKASNYKDYLVKNDSSLCEYGTPINAKTQLFNPLKITVAGKQIQLKGAEGPYTYTISDLFGRVVSKASQSVMGNQTIAIDQKGVYMVSVQTSAGITNKVISTALFR